MDILSDLTSPLMRDSLCLSPDQIGGRTTEILRSLFSVQNESDPCGELNTLRQFLLGGNLPIVYHLRRYFSSVKKIQRWWRRSERRKTLRLAAAVLQWGVQQEGALRKHREQIVKAKRIGLPTSRATSQFAVLATSSPESMYEKAITKWHENVKRCCTQIRCWMTANGKEAAELRKKIKQTKLQMMLFSFSDSDIQQLKDDEEEFEWLQSTIPQIDEVVVTHDNCSSNNSSANGNGTTFPRLSQRRASLSADAAVRLPVANTLRRCESDNVMSPIVFKSISGSQCGGLPPTLPPRSISAFENTSFDSNSTSSTPRAGSMSPRAGSMSPRAGSMSPRSRVLLRRVSHGSSSSGVDPVHSERKVSPVRRHSSPMRGNLRSPKRNSIGTPPSPPPSPRPILTVPGTRRRATNAT